MPNVPSLARRPLMVFALGFAAALAVPGLAISQEMPKVGEPVLITSLGQSLDAFQLQLAVKRAKIQFVYDQHAEPDMLEGTNALFLAVGASLKGFGEAGISIADERERARHFLHEAETRGMPVIVFHLGGADRRDDLSNQLIEVTAPHADALFVMTESDADGMFSKIAAENGIPLYVVPNMPKLLPLLKELVVPQS